MAAEAAGRILNLVLGLTAAVLCSPCIVISVQGTSSAVDNDITCTSPNGANITCVFQCDYPGDWVDHYTVTSIRWYHYSTIRGSLSFTSTCTVDSGGVYVSCYIFVKRTYESCRSNRMEIKITDSRQQVTHAADFHYDEGLVAMPPSSITLTAESASQISVSWTARRDVIGANECWSAQIPTFWVEISYMPLNGQISEPTTVDGEIEQPAILSQLETFSVYEVKIRLAYKYNPPGHELWGLWSSPVQARTLGAAPRGQVKVEVRSEPIATQPTYRNVRLSWTELSLRDAQGIIQGYKVHLSSGDQSWTVTNSTSFTIRDLDRFQQYDGWILPFNGVADGERTDFTIEGSTAAPGPPFARVWSTSDGILVSVVRDFRVDEYVSMYRVDWHERGTNDRRSAKIQFDVTEEIINYTISHVTSDTLYDITLWAGNQFGNSSRPYTIKMDQMKPDYAPRDFIVDTEPSKPDTLLINLTSIESIVSSKSVWYRVFYCTVSEGPCATSANKTPCAGHTSMRNVTTTETPIAELSGLQPYTCYKLWLRAMNDAGSGPESQHVLESTLEGRPSSPVDMKVLRVSAFLVEVTWSPPVRPNGRIAYYNITYNGNSTLSNTTYARLSTHGYAEYNVTVRACHVNGTAPELACSNATLLPRITTPIGAPSQPRHVTTIKTAYNVVKIKWYPPRFANGPPANLYYVIDCIETGAQKRVNTTDVSFEFKCGSEKAEYTFGVAAAMKNTTDELRSEIKSVKEDTCDLHRSSDAFKIGLLIGCITFFVSCCIAWMVHWRCFRQTEKFDKIYFADIVLRSKEIQHLRGPIAHKMGKVEKERFDDVKTSRPAAPAPQDVSYIFIDRYGATPNRMQNNGYIRGKQ